MAMAWYSCKLDVYEIFDNNVEGAEPRLHFRSKR